MCVRGRRSRRRFGRPLAVAPLAFFALTATGEARPVPEPVREQVFRASVQLGVGALDEVQGASVEVAVTGRYTRCPRPRRGLYACSLTVRTRIDGDASACRVLVHASRRRWGLKASGCPPSWRPERRRR
jgi:hypothetical protein